MGESKAAAEPAKSKAIVILVVVVCVFFALAGVLSVLAVLFLPTLTHAKQKANRTRCANNLRQVGLAMMQYADDKRYHPHLAALRALDGDATTSDSPKIARGLIYHGYLDDPGCYICPESTDLSMSRPGPVAQTAQRTWFWSGKTIADGPVSPLYDGQPDPALDKTTELSYGWTRRGLPSGARGTDLLSADRALSGNHREGWNVGQVDGSVTWTLAPSPDLTATDAANPASGYLCLEPSGP